MHVETVRSGLVESRHPVEVVAIATDGSVTARRGDLGRPYFARSAIKPIQATVAAESGAQFGTQQLAVACASHNGEAVHVAHVRAMLDEVGLDESDLECPPAWPTSIAASRRAAAAGDRARPLFHNCSGKHAGMLRACVAQGWPTAGYTDPDHPLQQRVSAAMGDVLGADPGPVGVDGCGAPAFRVTTLGLARAFARIAADARFAAAAAAMAQYPALTSGTDRPELKIAIVLGAVVKGGAEGCIGIALRGRVGVAAKADDGSFSAAAVGVVTALVDLGIVTEHSALEAAARIPVLGGGRRVGWIAADLAR